MTQAESVPAVPLRFGLSLMNFDDFAEARRVADLARVAEHAGWEALLLWDHLGFVWGTPSGDPWTLVTAAALVTDRLLVGTDVSVIARERPMPFARQLTTIDRLSGGRLVLGVGIGGAPDEYRKAGEPVDPRERAALTDEMLDVVRACWPVRPSSTTAPRWWWTTSRWRPCRQEPISVWVGGGSRGARRRAARHDGWIPVTVDDEGRPCLTPDDVRAALAEIRAERAAAGVAPDARFVVGIHGETPGPGEDGAAIVRPGPTPAPTWWLEMLHGWRGSHR